MAVLELTRPDKTTGGIGCDCCIYWQEYGEMNKELYGLEGKWGRCSSQQEIDHINRTSLLNKITLQERLNTKLKRLSIQSIVLSTTNTFTCRFVKIPDDRPRQDKETTDKS
jgi:hypothetical protein